MSKDPTYHSLLRTTCVATLLDGGHANNALPQRAGANVNCRIFPGETVEETQAAIATAIGDVGVKVTVTPPVRPKAVPPPLDPKIIGPAEQLVAKYFPGVPLVPAMSTGGTDGIFLAAIGIPVYGAPGGWGDPRRQRRARSERTPQRPVGVHRSGLPDGLGEGLCGRRLRLGDRFALTDSSWVLFFNRLTKIWMVCTTAADRAGLRERGLWVWPN